MFTQFRVRYPKGSLIAELVTIEHGKYVVRALLQVEGVTLATGLAAAETVELAEDQARTRALAVLGIHPTTAIASSTIDTPPISSEVPVPLTPTPIPQSAFSSENLGQAGQSPLSFESFSVNQDAAGLSSREPKRPDISSGAAPIPWEANGIPFADEFPLGEIEMPQSDEVYELETPASVPPKPALGEPKLLSEREVSSRPPAPKFNPSETQTNTGVTPPKGGPTDMSDIIAMTDVEIKRLGWTQDQGRDYLLKTYGKRGRQQLTDEQLLDFLHYLESQPSPPE